MTRKLKYQVEDDLLLPYSRETYTNLGYQNKKRKYNKNTYSRKRRTINTIYLYIKRKLKELWESYIIYLCQCFYTKKEEHVCFFTKITPEYNYSTDRPQENIIYWGELGEEEVFFTEQEQKVIDYMKEKIKKSN